MITLRRIVQYLGAGRIVLHTAFVFLANNALIANWGSSANYRGLVLNPPVPLTQFRPTALTSAPIEPLHSQSDCFCTKCPAIICERSCVRQLVLLQLRVLMLVLLQR